MVWSPHYGHISIHDGICTTIMQGMIEGVLKRGRPKNQWLDNI